MQLSEERPASKDFLYSWHSLCFVSLKMCFCFCCGKWFFVVTQMMCFMLIELTEKNIRIKWDYLKKITIIKNKSQLRTIRSAFNWRSIGVQLAFIRRSFGFHSAFIRRSFGVHLAFIWRSFGVWGQAIVQITAISAETLVLVVIHLIY